HRLISFHWIISEDISPPPPPDKMGRPISFSLVFLDYSERRIILAGPSYWLITRKPKVSEGFCLGPASPAGRARGVTRTPTVARWNLNPVRLPNSATLAGFCP